LTTVPSPAERNRSDQEALPFVSVIVPVRNEAGFLTRCLSALGGQDYPRDLFEVIVLDGESTDTTAVEAEEAARTLGSSIGALRTAVSRLRKQFGEQIRLEIARTVSAPDLIEEEFRYLRSVLGRM